MTDAGPVLVLGHLGMLGRAYCELLEARGVPWVGLDRDDLDIADPTDVARCVEPRFRTVVNCAAFTNVDGAEADEATAMRVNGEAVGVLARRCVDTGAFLIHFSTDYVFDGAASSPYPVDAPIAPIGAYGRTKAEGERRLVASGVPHLLVRTSWLYAPWGKNFVLTMARLTQERPSLKVVGDQRGRPTDARHLADASWGLREAGRSGTFHVTDGGECSWWELARFVADEVGAGASCQIDACTTAEWNAPAPRPAYSVLGLEKTEDVLGPMPPWKTAVRSALASRPDGS